MIQTNGTVICKICGEILQSRTHWYRHKYKLHVPSSGQPSPLFQCEQCNAYFKSRKGYMGHISSRHVSSDESDHFCGSHETIDSDMAVIVAYESSSSVKERRNSKGSK